MRLFLRIVKLSIIGAIGVTVLGVITVLIAYLVISPTLPAVDELADVQLQVPLRVYSKDGKLIQVFGEKRRIPVAIEDIPATLKNAFVAGEDARFFEHPGVDYQGIIRAVWHIVKTGGEKGPGGSTITQQLARDFGFVSRKKLYTRKLKEWFLAIKIERELSKNEILELYLNKIYLGTRSYGVAAAAQAYYGKNLDELSLAECAMIASLPKAPSRINPINNPARALERRNYVLGRMLDLGYIDANEHAAAAQAQDFAFPHEPKVEIDAPYAAEMVRAKVTEMLGNEAYTGGYVVHTTFDSRLQHAANRAVRNGLIAYDRRHGYRGPEAHFDATGSPADWNDLLDRFTPAAGLLPALVIVVEAEVALAYLADGQTITLPLSAMDWARAHQSVNRLGPRPRQVADVLAIGDIIRVARDATGEWQLSQLPDIEGALISVQPEDGAMAAIVGGFDFSRSKFNRAIQAKRQPGSSFKPFVYAAALDSGYTTATRVNDAPVVFDDDRLERSWKPENYSEQFFGPTRLREGMVKSRNLVSIRVLRDIGVRYAWEYALRFGFSPADIPQDLSMALGSGAVPPLSMARAYAGIANGGYLIEPYFIERITDGQGRIAYQANPALACHNCPQRALSTDVTLAATDDTTVLGDALAALESELPLTRLAEQIMSPEINYLITSMMRDVVKRGTGVKAMALKRGDLAGKTGTTNDQRDAWFSGFNHAIVTTTWVGFDRMQPLGESEVGGNAALPMWMEFMTTALDGVEEQVFDPPSGVVFARINPDTGELCQGDAAGCIMEVFHRDHMPEPPGKGAPSKDLDDEEDPYSIF